MEPLFPLGDWRWGVILFGLLSLIGFLYHSERKLWVRHVGGWWRKRTDHPPPDYWRKAEQHFDRINGEVQAIWQLYEESHVKWSVYANDDRDRRRVERFLSEARRLGRVVSMLLLKARKFPSVSFTDDADHWLNIVGAIVEPSSTAGDGVDQRGKYESGGIDDLVDASKVACIRLASEVR